MKNNKKFEELQAALDIILIDLKSKRDSINKTIDFAGSQLPFHPYIDDINKAITLLEIIKCTSNDNPIFYNKALETEKLFNKSSGLKEYILPNFKDFIPEEILTFEKIEFKLKELENKSKNLLDRGHKDASDSVKNIVDSLRKLNISYGLIKTVDIDYQPYKKKAIDIIRDNSFGLDQHRGCKEILVNLLWLISTLGIAHIVRYMNHGYFLFTPPTDTSNKLDNLEEIIRNSNLYFPSTSNMKV